MEEKKYYRQHNRYTFLFYKLVSRRKHKQSCEINTEIEHKVIKVAQKKIKNRQVKGNGQKQVKTVVM